MDPHYTHYEKSRNKWDSGSITAILAVFLIISVEYYAFVIVFSNHLLKVVPGLAGFMLFEIHFFIIMMIWSYIRVATNGPGYLSPQINEGFANIEEIKEKQRQLTKYKHSNKNKGKGHKESTLSDSSSVDATPQANLEDPEAEISQQEIKKLASNPILQLQEVGYCFKCKRIKIPRAHHCKICQKCVLRMDHHCPWTGNCVGLYNHKFFILFLIYAFITIFQIFLWQCSFYLLNRHNFQSGLAETNELIIQVSVAMSAGMSIAIGTLLIFQIYISYKNLTTIENHVKGIAQRNPFDKGVMRNFEEVLGIDRLNWLWPTDPKLMTEEELFLLRNY